MMVVFGFYIRETIYLKILALTTIDCELVVGGNCNFRIFVQKNLLSGNLSAGVTSEMRITARFKIGNPLNKVIVGTWRSTHALFNLVKKSLVLVKNDTQRKKSFNEHKKPINSPMIFFILFCIKCLYKFITNDIFINIKSNIASKR